MVTLLLLLALSLPLALTQARPQPVTSLLRRAEPLGSLIDLGYTKVQGLAYPNGISQWLGVPYAQPPLGKLRFAAPQPVTPSATIQQATGVRSPSLIAPFTRIADLLLAWPLLHWDSRKHQ